MKLSEAMLLGSISTTQGFDVSCVSPQSPTPCAIGTALYAEGVIANNAIAYNAFWEKWPWTRYKQVTHPTRGYVDSVTRCIYTLNDVNKWSRPRIAEWIATIEPQDIQVEQPITLEVPCEVK